MVNFESLDHKSNDGAIKPTLAFAEAWMKD